jgi:hypothetical protein
MAKSRERLKNAGCVDPVFRRFAPYRVKRLTNKRLSQSKEIDYYAYAFFDRDHFNHIGSRTDPLYNQYADCGVLRR